MRIASQMKEEVVLLSSDAIRGEIYGDKNCQRDPGRVFDIMHQRTIAALSQGVSVIYDATNLSCKRRMNFLKSIAHIDCKKTCVVVVTTPEDIEERMKLRDRKVPMEVVHKQLYISSCASFSVLTTTRVGIAFGLSIIPSPRIVQILTVNYGRSATFLTTTLIILCP